MDEAPVEIAVRSRRTTPACGRGHERCRVGQRQAEGLLQLRHFTAQDVSLLDALRVWKSNADKLYAGVDECPSAGVLHATEHRPPMVACQTCHHKFHPPALPLGEHGRRDVPAVPQPLR